MGTKLRFGGVVLAVVAIALIGTSAATAANGNGNGNGNGGSLGITICHKPQNGGGTTMTVGPVAAFVHLLLHGDTLGPCAAPPVDGEDDEQEEEPTCEQLENCEQPEETCEEQETCEQPEETCEEQETCEQPDETCEEQETCEQPEEDPTPTQQAVQSVAPAEPPAESRSLFCLTTGLGGLGNGNAAGVTLDLPDGEGALLVEQGLATPAIFYAGVGVSCDLLPGFTYAGFWVDHVGDVVPGVAVYPYFVPTAG